MPWSSFAGRINSTLALNALAFIAGALALLLPIVSAASIELQLALALLVAIFAETSAWGRLSFATRRLRGTAWVIPFATVCAGLSLRPEQLFGVAGTQPLVALLPLGFLAGALVSQWSEAERGAHFGHAPRAAVVIPAYVALFFLFVWLFLSRTPLVTAPGCALLSGLVTAATLRQYGPRAYSGWAYAAAVGVVLGQVGASAVFWHVPVLVLASLALLFFYVLAGLAESALREMLEPRVLVEYGIVTVIGIILIASSSPWRV